MKKKEKHWYCRGTDYKTEEKALAALGSSNCMATDTKLTYYVEKCPDCKYWHIQNEKRED